MQVVGLQSAGHRLAQRYACDIKALGKKPKAAARHRLLSTRQDLPEGRGSKVVSRPLSLRGLDRHL
jgi:hypothetical protein